MKIGKKVLLPALVAVGFMLLVGLTAYRGLAAQSAAIDELESSSGHTVRATDLLGDIRHAQAATYRLFSWLGSYKPEQVKAALDGIGARIDHAGKVVKDWQDKGDLIAEERTALEDIATALGKYRKMTAQAIDMASDDLATGAAMMQSADAAYQKLEQSVEALVAIQKREAEAAGRSAQAASTRSLILLAAAILAALVSSLTVALVVARRITTPIAAAVGAASHIAGGDLTAAIDVRGNDETAQLLAAMRSMADGLKDLVRQIADSANQLGDATHAVADDAHHIAATSSQQSSSLTAVAAAIEQMTVSVSSVSDHAARTRDLAEATAKVAEEGLDMVNRAAGEIDSVAQAIGDASRRIETLKTDSDSISAIVGVISEIADQTNLLALNAAIEAARAGEQGRGFAVVADEVRKLAEKTAAATNEIKGIIGTIQTETHNTVDTMAAVGGSVQSGVSLMRALLAPLDQLHKNAQESLANMVDLSDATREQSTASESIARQVEEIARATEDNSHVTVRTSAAARKLGDLANSLLGLVRRFRI
ncbi:MAG: methyl-accepting chemotaxis protein [Rhodocyclales bacterium]|nr:methyl-accepting chemotaxis protein [Rhodocyclales bacterium]